jgi:hypothetical protein
MSGGKLSRQSHVPGAVRPSPARLSGERAFD